MLLCGGQAGAAVVVRAHGHDLGLVQVAVPLAHGRREAEDGVGVVGQGRRRVHASLHGLHLRVVVVEEAVLARNRRAAVSLALHGERHDTRDTRAEEKLGACAEGTGILKDGNAGLQELT